MVCCTFWCFLPVSKSKSVFTSKGASAHNTTRMLSFENVVAFMTYYDIIGRTLLPMKQMTCEMTYDNTIAQNSHYVWKYLLFFFYLPYLSCIHEKANCIARFWTVCPHSLGSCYFRGVWATCLPQKGGASR